MNKVTKFRKIVSIITALSLLAALCACSGGGNSAADEPGANSQSPSLNLSSSEKTTYMATDVPLPFEADYINNILSGGDRLFFLYNKAENDEYTYFVAGMDADGGNFTVIQQAANISGMATGSGGLWTLSSDDGETYRINSFAADGTPLGSFDLPEEVDTQLYTGSLNVDGDGNIYYTAYNDTTMTVYVMEQDGKLAFELKRDSLPLHVITTKEGQVGICPYDMSIATNSANYEFSLCLIDAKAQSWGSTVALGTPQNLYPGQSHSFYLNDTSDLYAYDADTGSSEVVFNWLEAGAVYDLHIVAELDDGSFAVIGGKIDYTTLAYSYELSIIAPSDGGDQANKQVITLSGIVHNTTLAASVAEFNKKSDMYRIEYTTYLSMSDIYSEDTINDALDRFNTDILSGKMADIMDMSNMSVDLYASKGLLEDLYTYIDADPSLNRSDFFESVLDAMSIDGKLSYIANGVYIYTMFASAETLGSEPGITAVEFSRLLSEYPDMVAPLGAMVNKSTFLTYILYGNVDVIDWSTGKCKFDSPEFIQLLEIANRMPQEQGEYDMTDMRSILESSRLVADGSQVAAIESIYTIEQIAAYNQLLGDNLNIIGLPVEQGACHVVDAPIKLSISSRSQNKEAAWDFVRTLLEEDVQQNNVYIPISRTAFDKLMKNAMDGNSIFSMYYTDMEITEDDVALLESLLDSVSYSASYDQMVMSIVSEEAEPFFAGSVTAEQAAGYMQNRIQTYVNEQR